MQILISVSVCLWNNTSADLHPLVGNSGSMMEDLRGVEGHDVIAPHALDPCLCPIISLDLTKVLCVVEDLSERWQLFVRRFGERRGGSGGCCYYSGGGTVTEVAMPLITAVVSSDGCRSSSPPIMVV